MLFSIGNTFEKSGLNSIKFVSDKEMMGIKNLTDNLCVLPIEYDNIYMYGKNVFVVHKKGKIGAVRIETDKVCFIAECEYDMLDTFGHDLIFSSGKKVRYYNSVTNIVRDFVDIIVETPFLYCKDEKYQYILYGESGREIYKKEYTSYSESCFCFCGNTEKGPVFYDARYSTYLYPTKDGYKVYEEIFNHPIVVTGQNICNITEGENGIGVIDSYGKLIIENQYDSVKVELKITAINKNEEVQKIIPFQKKAFEKGMVSQIEDWV